MEYPHNSHPLKYRRRTAQQAEASEKRRMAPFMVAMKALHDANVPDAMTPEELEKQRKNQEIMGKLVAPMGGLEWVPFDLGHIPAAWMRQQDRMGNRRAILYCHGGGYTSGNLGYSRILASKLCRDTGLDVLAFEYRLAPEFHFPAPLEDAQAVWDYMMDLGYKAEDVIVVGDSAGGNLALILSLALKRAGRPLPGALLLFSPWTDLLLCGDSLEANADIDPVLSPEYVRAARDAYLGGHDPHDPLLSPLMGDFRDFPPTLIQVGTHEILYSDAVRLEERMKAAGVTCRLEVWEDMWHVFQMFPNKKAADAIRNATHFLLAQL